MKSRTGTQATVTGALVADAASQVTVAVRTTSTPVVVVSDPVQVVRGVGGDVAGGGAGQGRRPGR